MFAGKVQGYGYPTRRIDETAIAGLESEIAEQRLERQLEDEELKRGLRAWMAEMLCGNDSFF